MVQAVALVWLGQLEGRFYPSKPPLDDSQVRIGELKLHGSHISRHIHTALDMGDAFIGKGTGDVNQGVNIAELG